MTWGHPPLCVCIPCATRRETVLRKRVEELEALAAKLEAENAELRRVLVGAPIPLEIGR